MTAAGVAMAAIVAGVAVATHDSVAEPVHPLPPAGPSAKPSPSAAPDGWHNDAVYSAAAADAEHLYSVVLHCRPDVPKPIEWYACDQALVRSDDGGRTWRVRNANLGHFETTEVTPLSADVLLLSAEKLVEPGSLDKSGHYVSVDGGTTWKPIAESKTSVASIPANGWLEPIYGEPGAPVRLGVGDPARRRIAPLATAPPLDYGTWRRAATGAIWVGGEDSQSRRPGVAVSTDAGRHWTCHVFTDVPPADGTVYATGLATLDGKTGYAVSMTGKNGRAWVHRTTDGGQTWQLVDPGGTAPWSYGGGSSYVTPDGAHVIADLGHDDNVTFRISQDGGGRYEPVTLTGLAKSGIYGAGTPVRALPGGGYLAYAPNDALYVSADGLNFRRIVPTFA